MSLPPSAPHQRSIALATALYRRLLVAYPASFRQHYGAQMLQVFRDSCHEAGQAHGLRGLLVLWMWALADLCKTALAERLAVARPLARPAAIRLCGLFTLVSGLGLMLLYAVLLLGQMGIHLSFLAFLASLDWQFFYFPLLLDVLYVCCSIFGLLGVLLVQRSRAGRVVASVALLAQVVDIVGGYVYRFVLIYYGISPSLAWNFYEVASLLIAAGLIGCGLVMSRPRLLSPWGCLLMLLGLSLGGEWTRVLLAQQFGGSGWLDSPFVSSLFALFMPLVRYLLWAGFGYALFIRREISLIRPQPATA